MPEPLCPTMGEIIELNGGAVRLQRVEGRYDYQASKTGCAVCGGIGMPWRGWFHCEDGPHVAFIETGECFDRLAELAPDNPAAPG